MRYKYLILDDGAEAVRRFYEPDVEALLCEPKRLPTASRARLVPKGWEWKAVVMDLDRQLYSWVKEGQPFASPAEALQIVRQQLHQRLAEKGLRLG